jgi:hypothetical protein
MTLPGRAFLMTPTELYQRLDAEQVRRMILGPRDHERKQLTGAVASHGTGNRARVDLLRARGY